MKKLNLSSLRQVTMIDTATFLQWLHSVGETVTVRKMKISPPIRPSKLSFMLKLADEFELSICKDEHVRITEAGKQFANAEFSKKMAMTRDLLLSYEPVQEIMDLLTRSVSGRIKRTYVEDILTNGSNSSLVRSDVIGFIEWAQSCELFNYDKKRGEIMLRGNVFPPRALNPVFYPERKPA